MPECGEAEEETENSQVPHPGVEHLITQGESEKNKRGKFAKSYLRVSVT